MSYIPPNAKWYLADIVLEIKVQDEDLNLVHINLTLIRADSPEQAYEHAMAIGKEHEMGFQNTDGKPVTITFRGLRGLNVIHEELEDGSELLFEEQIGLSDHEINEMVRSREELNVFRPKTALD